MPQIFVSLDLDELQKLEKLAQIAEAKRIEEGGSGRRIGAATIASRMIRVVLYKLELDENQGVERWIER